MIGGENQEFEGNDLIAEDGSLLLRLTPPEANWLLSTVTRVQARTGRTKYMREQIIYGLEALFREIELRHEFRVEEGIKPPA